MAGRTLQSLLAVIALLVLSGEAAAQAAAPAHTEAERDSTQAELDSVTKEITITEERQEALREEIAEIDQDRATLNSMLIGTTERARKLEGQLDQTESRLRGLGDQEKRLQDSLRARRGVLAEVLAALQRMGRNPPPAIVVRPQDALTAVRSAILLGAVVPEIRLQAEALALDLKQLVSLRTEMAKERDRLRTDATTLVEEKRRIELLIAQKHRVQAEREKALDAERKKAADLAERAGNLKELIASIEREVASAAAAAEAARKAEAERLAAAKGKPAPTAKPSSLGRSDRIAPAVAFADAKGLLPMPVNGTPLKSYGEDDGLGGKAQGLSLGTRSAARVNTPADGWVVYAGPFRSYGQLLIINAGGGYHILLAGMQRIDVELGQFVLAGEPVAVMGDRRLASAGAVETGGTQPVLYVEFRKDSNAIDPSPWWAGRTDEKAGG